MSEDWRNELVTKGVAAEAVGSMLRRKFGVGGDLAEITLVGLPSAQPQRMKGKWIEQEDYNLDTYYDCSVCGESWCTIDGTPWDNGMNFCPNCGADMRGESE